MKQVNEWRNGATMDFIFNCFKHLIDYQMITFSLVSTSTP